jgi:hypothetical protein
VQTPIAARSSVRIGAHSGARGAGKSDASQIHRREQSRRTYLETFDMINETGEPYRPDPLPVIYCPEGDEDE